MISDSSIPLFRQLGFLLFAGKFTILLLGIPVLSQGEEPAFVDLVRSDTADSVDLHFESDAAMEYRVESSDDLEIFTEVETLTGTGAEMVRTYPLSGKTRIFYRLNVSVLDTSPALPTTIQMVAIPAGSFTMGDDGAVGPNADAHKPERTVNISAFQMSEAEITNAEYVEFLNAAMAEGLIVVEDEVLGPNTSTYVKGAPGQTFEGHKLYDLTGSRVLKDHDNPGDGIIDPENPLNQAWIEYDDTTMTFSMKDPEAVDWDNFDYIDGESRSDWEDLDADKLPTVTDVSVWPANFIKWYGAKVFADYYDCDLPTEAEWEYAAKGGMDYEYATDDGTIDEADDGTVDAIKANFNEDDQHPDDGHVVKVKSYPANPFGLHDMSGNVWEWCLDWFDEDFYANQPNPDQDPLQDQLVLAEVEPDEFSTDPVFTGGPGSAYNGDTRIRRGGSWNYHPSANTTTNRERDYTWRGNDHFGFRIVKR